MALLHLHGSMFDKRKQGAGGRLSLGRMAPAPFRMLIGPEIGDPGAIIILAMDSFSGIIHGV
jgi:hypothetical protein